MHKLALVVEVRKAERDLMSPRRDLRVRKVSARRLASNHHVAKLDALLCVDARKMRGEIVSVSANTRCYAFSAQRKN